MASTHTTNDKELTMAADRKTTPHAVANALHAALHAVYDGKHAPAKVDEFVEFLLEADMALAAEEAMPQRVAAKYATRSHRKLIQAIADGLEDRNSR